MADLWALLWAPFLMCLVLTGIHAYLGIHVLAREVVFVDIALAQNHWLCEVIVVDDYSTDNSRAIITGRYARITGSQLYSKEQNGSDRRHLGRCRLDARMRLSARRRSRCRIVRAT